MATPSSDGKTQATQVLAQCWHTRIPVHLSLAPDNISSPSAVRPIYLMAPRQGYLTVVASQAWPHLQHVLPSVPGRPGPPRPWFDCQGVPLKWHLPCGVLYDLLADVGQQPWKLTVHYTHPPDALVGWDTGNTPQAQFMNSLKESCYICRGPDGSGSVMRMGSAAQDELWTAVQSGDVAAYRSALEVLRIAPTQRHGNAPSIPVRLLLRRSTPAATSQQPRPAAATVTTTTGGGGGGGGTVAEPAAGAAAPQAPSAAGGAASVHRSSAGGAGAASFMASGSGTGGFMWESYITATSRPVPALQGGPGGQPTSLAQLLHLVLPHVFPEPPPSLTGGDPQQTQQPQQGPGQGAAAAAGGSAGRAEGASAAAHGPPPTGPTTAGSAGSMPSGAAAMAAAGAAAAGPASGTSGTADPGGFGEEGWAAEGRPAASGRTGEVGAEAAGTDGEPGAVLPRTGEGTPETSGGTGATAATAAEGAGGSQGREAQDAAMESVRREHDPVVPSRAEGSTGPDGGFGMEANGVSAVARGVPDPSAGQNTAAEGTPPTGGGESSSSAAAQPGKGQSRWPACRVLVGGICPPLAAPIGWLHAAMHAPDLFLYVVVRMETDGEGGQPGVTAANPL